MIFFRKLLDLSRPQKRLLILGLDLVLIPSAMLIALGLVNRDVLAQSLISPEVSSRIGLLILILTITGGIYSSVLGLPRIKLKSFENNAILRTGVFAGLTALTGAILTPLMTPGLFGESVLVVFGMGLAILAVVSRIGALWVLQWLYQSGARRKRVLIYGAGQTGVQLAFALKTDPDFEPVAFVDDNPTLRRMVVAGMEVHSPVQLERLIEDLRIQRIVVAMPSIGRAKQTQIQQKLRKLRCEVRIVPSFAALVDENDILDRVKSANPGDFLNREDRAFDRKRIDGTYEGKSILVSGAGGSIGSELARQILEMRPARLVLFDVSEPALYEIDRELRLLLDANDPTRLHPVLGSVTNREELAAVIARFEVSIIVHAAAYKHVPMVEQNPIAGLRNNTLGTRTIAEVAREANVERFVLVSTDKAVRPTSIMGATKRLAELMVQDLSNKSGETVFSIVRFGNVLGSSGSVVPLFQEQINRGGPVTVTHPEVTRYFMTIGEAAHLVLMAGAIAEGGEVFVLDMGDPVPIRQLAQQMIERSGYTLRSADAPDGDIEIEYTGLRPGEKLYEELLIGNDSSGTEHEKIMKAREVHLSEIELASALRDVNRAIEKGDVQMAQDLVERWVQGYHPSVATTAIEQSDLL